MVERVQELIGRAESRYMTRLHLTPWGWWPFRRRLYLHVFWRGDADPWPHDHPFPFRSIVLWGGYDEEVWEYYMRGDQLGWWSHTNTRGWLSNKAVRASHTHRITRLHKTPTITLVIRGEKEADWGFMQDISDGAPSAKKIDWWRYLGLPAPEAPAYPVSE